MRVYQFRHIRAERQCSRVAGHAIRRGRAYHARSAPPPHPARPRARRRSRTARGRRSGRHLGATREARRGRRHAAAPTARGRGRTRPHPRRRRPPEARARRRRARRCVVPPHPRRRAEDARRSPVESGTGCPGALALRRCPRRRLGRPPRVRARAAPRRAGRDRLADGDVPLAAGAAGRSRSNPDRRNARLPRRDGSLGPEPRDRGPGAEDRDHRRRHRPDAPVLRPSGLLVPTRLSRRGTPPTRRRR